MFLTLLESKRVEVDGAHGAEPLDDAFANTWDADMDQIHTTGNGDTGLVVEIPVNVGLVDRRGSKGADESTVNSVDTDETALFLVILKTGGQVNDAHLGFELASSLIRRMAVVGVRDNGDLSEEGINVLLTSVTGGGKSFEDSW